MLRIKKQPAVRSSKVFVVGTGYCGSDGQESGGYSDYTVPAVDAEEAIAKAKAIPNFSKWEYIESVELLATLD